MHQQMMEKLVEVSSFDHNQADNFLNYYRIAWPRYKLVKNALFLSGAMAGILIAIIFVMFILVALYVLYKKRWIYSSINKNVFQSNANRPLADSTGHIVKKFEHVQWGSGTVRSKLSKFENIQEATAGAMRSPCMARGSGLGSQGKMFEQVQVVVTLGPSLLEDRMRQTRLKTLPSPFRCRAVIIRQSYFTDFRDFIWNQFATSFFMIQWDNHASLKGLKSSSYLSNVQAWLMVIFIF